MAGSVLLLAGMVAWQLRPIEHTALGQAKATVILDCEFEKFRQIMVRKNATKAIVGDSGMKLLEERVLDIDLDTSRDDRPLLNAIRGKSKTDLVAVKQLTVQLTDPMLEADELVLRQDADIQEHRIHVETQSKRPAGRLQQYMTTLDAFPDDDGAATRVELSVDMNVVIRVPKFFRHKADEGVQQAAEDAIAGQETSIKDFVALYADERFIIPDLKR